MSNISTESQMTFKPTETPSAVLSEVETETLQAPPDEEEEPNKVKID